MVNRIKGAKPRSQLLRIRRDLAFGRQATEIGRLRGGSLRDVVVIEGCVTSRVIG